MAIHYPIVCFDLEHESPEALGFFYSLDDVKTGIEPLWAETTAAYDASGRKVLLRCIEEKRKALFGLFTFSCLSLDVALAEETATHHHELRALIEDELRRRGREVLDNSSLEDLLDTLRRSFEQGR